MIKGHTPLWRYCWSSLPVSRCQTQCDPPHLQSPKQTMTWRQATLQGLHPIGLHLITNQKVAQYTPFGILVLFDRPLKIRATTWVMFWQFNIVRICPKLEMERWLVLTVVQLWPGHVPADPCSLCLTAGRACECPPPTQCSSPHSWPNSSCYLLKWAKGGLFRSLERMVNIHHCAKRSGFLLLFHVYGELLVDVDTSWWSTSVCKNTGTAWHGKHESARTFKKILTHVRALDYFSLQLDWPFLIVVTTLFSSVISVFVFWATVFWDGASVGSYRECIVCRMQTGEKQNNAVQLDLQCEASMTQVTSH